MEDIKITAEPSPSGRSCKFIVDRALYADGSAYFNSKESAAESPLAKRLFDLEGVAGVLVSGNCLTVTAGPYDDWRPVAKQVALAIRDTLKAGTPCVGAAYRAPQGGREAEIRRRVQEVLENRVNPAIASHGGHIELIDVKGANVIIQMSGGCQGCASSAATLRLGVENMIREEVPEVADIVDATDHAAGANPYYSH